jgi:hypothetical protein
MAPNVDQPPPTGIRRAFSWARLEDWLLCLWVLVAIPLLGRLTGGSAPFSAGNPVAGALDLVAIACAAVCLSTGSSDNPGTSDETNWATAGPLTAGLLLVYLSGITALDLDSGLAWLPAALVIGLAVVVRLRVRRLPTALRRALVMPFVLVTGTLFTGAIDQVTGGHAVEPRALPVLAANPIVPLAFVVFSGIYFLMLVFAPRQVAEREGGPLTWVARYGLFLLAVIVGFT